MLINNSSPKFKFQVYRNEETVYFLFTEILRELAKKQDVIFIGLSGWNSVKGFYKLFNQNFVFLSRELKSKLRFVLLDERRVSSLSKDSNYKLIQESFFHEFVLTWDFKEYQLIKPSFDWNYGFFQIDIALFWIWEDWHIASIFPKLEESFVESNCYINIKNAPKLPKERITIPVNKIKEIPYTFVFYTWENKQEIFRKISSIKEDYKDIEKDFPVLLLTGEEKTCIFVNDFKEINSF